MLKSDSLFVTKYARNDNFFRKSNEMVLCLHVVKRTVFEEWGSFFSKTSLIYVQNDSLIVTKYARNDSFFSEKITENVSVSLHTP